MTRIMKLFEKMRIRALNLPNRIGVSPMCQYSADDGHVNAWHLVHLGSRAVGGAGLVMAEATAVEAAGRISPGCTGLWTDDHIASWQAVTAFIKEQGAVPGLQLAHAGRKASCAVAWEGGKPLASSKGGWPVIGPSPIAFDEGWQVPRELSVKEIQRLISLFVQAAHRALEAGFEVLEIHGAHGYLIHEFLSPFSNQRQDTYGGSFENRIRLFLEIAAAVRTAWPSHLPLFARISATDWTEGGWDLEQSVELSRRLKAVGIDLVDVSNGGNLPRAKIPQEALYQVPFSSAIRKGAEISTAAVGLITTADEAEGILIREDADLIFIGRELLRDPYWPLRAARRMGVEVPFPKQYLRAW